MMGRMSRRCVLVGVGAVVACSVLPARPYQQRREWPLAVQRPASLPSARDRLVLPGTVLLVREMQAAPGLDTRGLRTLLPDGAERLDNWEEWAVPPSQGVGACLRQWLAASGRFAAVLMPGSEAAADLVLESQLEAFVGVQATGRARVTFSLVLLRRARGRDVPVLQRTITGEAPLGATDGPALAASLQAALAQALAQAEAALAPFAGGPI